MPIRRVILTVLQRPSLWTALIAIAAYWNQDALRGKWVYDDAGSVAKNVVVNGQVPWQDAFKRDFWGTPMTEPASHKSFRPITTLTFKWNWLLAEHYFGTLDDAEQVTLWFHIVNIVLHGMNTGLLTEAASYVFDDDADNAAIPLGGTSTSTAEGNVLAQLITGLIFALHPVHAEAVSNITSRGELLMTFFFVVAFLSYASHIPTTMTTTGTTAKATTTTTTTAAAVKKNIFQNITYGFFIYVLPWICMAASLFSKEQGATTLCTLVAYDFLKHHGSVKHWFHKLLQKDPDSIHFLGRTIVLAIQTLLLVALRKWLNGESSPDFIYDQNPAGFAEDRLTRVFSTGWVHALYVRDMIFPAYLCPDWSGRSIQLIDDIADPRAIFVVLLWILAVACVQSLFRGLPSHATALEVEVRRIILMAFFAFMFLPFLLSSNLLVVVGLMKADRVIYLPLFGFCIMEALLIKTIFCSLEPVEEDQVTESSIDDNSNDKESPKQKPAAKLRVNWLGNLLVILQLGIFAVKLHERNIAWSSPELLWISAFNVNSRSHHTMYNCGYELSLRQRYDEAEKVMRPIGNARVDGPSNTFVYAMVLYNLNRCDEANYFIDIAMDVLEEQREEGGIRYQSSSLDRTKSNLLVARGYCTKDDVQQQGIVFQEAVRTDPRNTYAVQQFQAYLKRLEQIKEMKEKYGIEVGF